MHTRVLSIILRVDTVEPHLNHTCPLAGLLLGPAIHDCAEWENVGIKLSDGCGFKGSIHVEEPLAFLGLRVVCTGNRDAVIVDGSDVIIIVVIQRRVRDNAFRQNGRVLRRSGSSGTHCTNASARSYHTYASAKVASRERASSCQPGNTRNNRVGVAHIGSK